MITPWVHDPTCWERHVATHNPWITTCLPNRRHLDLRRSHRHTAWCCHSAQIASTLCMMKSSPHKNLSDLAQRNAWRHPHTPACGTVGRTVSQDTIDFTSTSSGNELAAHLSVGCTTPQQPPHARVHLLPSEVSQPKQRLHQRQIPESSPPGRGSSGLAQRRETLSFSGFGLEQCEGLLATQAQPCGCFRL